MGKRKGFGPQQLADHVGLQAWQVDRGRARGLVPAPALDSGRWSDEQAEEIAGRRDAIVEALGDHVGYGAKRGGELLKQACGLGDETTLWSCDVEALAERGLLDVVGDFKGWPLYDTRQLTSPADGVGDALQEIVAERTAWLEASLPTREAAARCGWQVAEYEKAAREQDMTAGRFGRWSLLDIERLAGNEELDEDIRGARLLGPEQAAQHLEIRRVDLDYCVEAGWVGPYTHTWIQVGRYKEVKVPLFKAGDLDAMLEIPGIDWEEVRATKPGRPSPLREFAQLGPSRAKMLHAFADQLGERYGVAGWARYHNARDSWTLNWLPDAAGGPTSEQVRQLLNADPVMAQYDVELLSDPIATVHWARRMLQPGAAVVLDTETTDLPGSIVEVAVVDCASGEVLLDTLVNPPTPISPGATAVHGITDADVVDAPTWETVLPDLLRATEGRTVLAYNEAFDRGCVVDDCQRLGLKAGHLGKRATWDCVMQARSDWEGMRSWLALGGDHRALGDAQSALGVLHELAEPPEWAVPKHVRQALAGAPPAAGRATAKRAGR